MNHSTLRQKQVDHYGFKARLLYTASSRHQNYSDVLSRSKVSKEGSGVDGVLTQ